MTVSVDKKHLMKSNPIENSQEPPLWDRIVFTPSLILPDIRIMLFTSHFMEKWIRIYKEIQGWK
jgi:hypothetical protein